MPTVEAFGWIAAAEVISRLAAPAGAAGTRATTFTVPPITVRRQVCPTDTRGGVQIVSPVQRLALRFRPHMGLRSRGIWVDRGCRADFRWWGGGGGGGAGNQAAAECRSSLALRTTWAPHVPGQYRGGVRLIRQRSDADCIYSRTWGYDRSRIWVDRGCRADFEVGKFASRLAVLILFEHTPWRVHPVFEACCSASFDVSVSPKALGPERGRATISHVYYRVTLSGSEEAPCKCRCACPVLACSRSRYAFGGVSRVADRSLFTCGPDQTKRPPASVSSGTAVDALPDFAACLWTRRRK